MTQQPVAKKWAPVFRKKTREPKNLGRVGDAVSIRRALAQPVLAVPVSPVGFPDIIQPPV